MADDQWEELREQLKRVGEAIPESLREQIRLAGDAIPEDLRNQIRDLAASQREKLKGDKPPKHRSIQYSAPPSHSPPSSWPEADRAHRQHVERVIGLSPQNSTNEPPKLDPEAILSNADLSRYGYRTGTVHMPEAPKPVPTSEPGDSDKNFAVAVAAYGGAFATGLFLLGDNSLFSGSWWYGAVLSGGGGLGLMSITPLFRPKLEAMRSTRSLWAVVTMTWLLLAINVGFAVYDHFWLPNSSITTIIPVSPERWPALTNAQATAFASRVRFIPPEDIVIACETLNCRDLADGIADILQKTPGWKVSILHRGGLGISGVTGIELNPSEPAAKALKEAIEGTTNLAVTVGSDTRKDFGANPSLLVIGTKPF